jgi:hypothetical protein
MENLAEYTKDGNVGKKDSLKRFFIGIGKGSILTLSIFLLMSNGKLWTSIVRAADNFPILETKKRTWIEYLREKKVSLLKSARSISVSDLAVFLGSISTVSLILLLFMSKSILEDSEAKQDLIDVLRRSLELCIKNSEPDPFN